MSTILYQEPKLNNPVMLASWAGIGNIGLVALHTLREQLHAQELGEIEPWDFFYPSRVSIKGGVLENLEFPNNKFYYARLASRDLLLFIGDEQPSSEGHTYAEGKKAYQMANLVLDVAQKFGCHRVYTSGAAVSLTHHTIKPRVWAAVSRLDLIQELQHHPNIVSMADIEGRDEWGSITGLNGLLLGVAKTRGLESICLMGEVPDYLSAAPFPYPKASKVVLEAFAKTIGVDLDFSTLDEMSTQVDELINSVYDKLPSEVKEKVEQRKSALARAETISEEEVAWMKGHIDELFKKGGRGNDRAA